jgi:hypothetical protein
MPIPPMADGPVKSLMTPILMVSAVTPIADCAQRPAGKAKKAAAIKMGMTPHDPFLLFFSISILLVKDF